MIEFPFFRQVVQQRATGSRRIAIVGQIIRWLVLFVFVRVSYSAYYANQTKLLS